MTSDPLSSADRTSISLQAISWQLPGEAFLLPVSGFPMPSQEALPVDWFLDRLTAIMATEQELSAEVFIQLAQFGGGKSRLARHGAQWEPALGLGVWPDRSPPTLWTQEDFMNLGPDETLRPLMCQVLRVTTSPAARDNARNVLLDLGSIVQMMIPDETTALLDRTRQLLLPSIEEPSFRSFPFYIPLLEGKSLEKAMPGQLESWFCGANVYIRESFEDKGILIASRKPLAPILKRLGGQLEAGPEPEWRIPYRAQGRSENERPDAATA